MGTMYVLGRKAIYLSPDKFRSKYPDFMESLGRGLYDVYKSPSWAKLTEHRKIVNEAYEMWLDSGLRLPTQFVTGVYSHNAQHFTMATITPIIMADSLRFAITTKNHTYLTVVKRIQDLY